MNRLFGAKPELPSRDDFGDEWRQPSYTPSPYPPMLADRREGREILLVHPNGQPLLVREPRPFGFRRLPVEPV